MKNHFDALETRSPTERERGLMASLAQQVTHARTTTAAFAELLSSVGSTTIQDRQALSKLPVIRKHEDFMARQKTRRSHRDIFGGYAAVGWKGHTIPNGVKRVFQSPGQIYEPEGYRGDFERMARAMFAAGFRAGDLVHNSFSYHLTPAGAMMESAALALCCAVFPGGVGNTELQLQAIQDLQPACYVGTPSFLRTLIERANDLGLPPLSFKSALVSGEAFPPAAREWLASRGVSAYQCYVTAELGLIAYETEAREGMVVDEGVILEIVRPGTGEVVPDGEVGEVVVTSLNPDYPLIRFGTGDLSAILPGPCPTGRTNIRIKGWLGRADQTAKIRGMFVHPSQIAETMRRHPELTRVRLVISGGDAGGEWSADQMVLKAETATPSEALTETLVNTMRSLTKLRSDVELVAIGTLPNDGKIIDDQRKLG